MGDSELMRGLYDNLYMQDGFAFNNAKQKKRILGNMYSKLFMQLSMARFKWEGVPDEIDNRSIEYNLFMNGLLVFLQDEPTNTGKYFMLKATPAGPIDYYDNPYGYNIYGPALMSKYIPRTKCVPIWSNIMRVPDHDIIRIYAEKMSEFDITIDIMAKNMRHPVLLVGDDRLRLSLQNAYRQLEEGQPVIALGKYLGERIDESIQSFDLGSRGSDGTKISDIQIAKTRIFNECMTWLGINNSNQDKRERLVASEVSSNDSQIFQFRNISLKTRKNAVEEINDRYGLNIEVSWDEESLLPLMTEAQEELYIGSDLVDPKDIQMKEWNE